MIQVQSQLNNQRKFFIICFFLAIATFSYLVGMGLTIKNVLRRQHAEKIRSELAPRVSELEFSYLALKSSVGIEKARELGFVDATEILIAKTSGNTLTLR